jgi:signal transduction histidine kinase
VGENTTIYKGKRNPVAKGTQGYQLVLGKPIFSHELDEPNLNEEDSKNPEIPLSQTFMTVPMIMGEKFIGCIELIRNQQQNFTQKDAKLIERLANHVVVVIENAMLYRQLRYVSALEEQGRLARELHDQMAQSLGYLNIKTSMTDDLVLNGKFDEAHQGLMEMKSVTKNIYLDVREGIFNLRTSASTMSGFLPALRSYLLEYRDRYGLDVRLDADVDDETEFSPETANQLMRIIQEALTNVRKHAQATRVYVRCQFNQDKISILIEDNGTGFDPAQEIGEQHYGLQIMKERAASVGGSVEYQSQPGTGTCVIIEAPFLTEE